MEILPRIERETDDLFAAAKESARDIRREADPMTGASEEWIVASIVRQASRNLTLGRLALFEQDLAGSVGSNIEQFDSLEPVLETGGGKPRDPRPGLHGETVVTLRVNAAQVIGLTIKHFSSETEAAIEEVRLGQRQRDVFADVAILDPKAELLAGPGKARPVEQIEISLRHLDEADQLIDRAETGAEVQLAGPV